MFCTFCFSCVHLLLETLVVTVFSSVSWFIYIFPFFDRENCALARHSFFLFLPPLPEGERQRERDDVRREEREDVQLVTARLGA